MCILTVWFDVTLPYRDRPALYTVYPTSEYLGTGFPHRQGSPSHIISQAMNLIMIAGYE